MLSKLFDLWPKDICKCNNKDKDDCSKSGLHKLGFTRYLTIWTTQLLKKNEDLNNNLTPNILTTLSLVSILGLYLGTKKFYYLSGILYILGCYFDIADGIHARLNNKCTDFGDYYDHVTDTLQILLVAYYIFFYIDISTKTKLVLFCVIFSSLVVTLITLGCEEPSIEEEHGSHTLYLLRYMCPQPCKNKIQYLKWGGYFTLQLIISIILIYHIEIDKFINT